MTEQAKDGNSREERVNAILAEYLDTAAAGGQAPDRAELLARHPELAEELAAFFAEDAQVRRLAEPLRSVAGPNDGAEAITVSPSPSPTSAPLDFVRYFGDYELLEEIARGGMGVVYKARQVSLDRIVALKMILAGNLAGEADVQRFRQEAQTAARLQHPGIVALHEVGEHEGQHFFSMDFIDGKTLADMVREHPLPAQQAIRYLRLVAEAVHFAHEQGVLHRDLKPSNVLVDCFDVPRVTDFGLAKNVNKNVGLTETGAVLGTPSYMPPEQASGQRGQVTPVSDVYALGAVLYELVTGRPPFRAATSFDTLLQVLNDEPAPPRLLNPAVSRDLETVILKCLDKDAARRYASAKDLAGDLGALLEGKAIKARRRSLPERLGMWMKRQGRTFKMVAASAVVAMLLLAALLQGLDWRRRWLLGGVSFSNDGPAQLVEIFGADDDILVVPPFTSPTREPVRLPEGDYRVRLSAPYRISETYRMLVERGQTRSYRIDLSERLLGDPLPCSRAFEFISRGDGGHDLLTVVEAGTLNRHDGITGRLKWTVTLGRDDRPNRSPNARDQSGFFASKPIYENIRYVGQQPARLLQPCRDLDGDGIPDLVWMNSAGSALLALSGKDGKFLWDLRPAGAVERQWGWWPAGAVERGAMVWFTPADKDTPLVVALFAGGRSAWAEAIDARTGLSVWRQPIEHRAPHGPWMLRVDGREVLVFLAGSRLVGLEPRTGKPAWTPVDLGFVPVGTPAFADLDGDGRIDTVLRGPEKHTVRAVTVPAGKSIWSEPVELPREVEDYDRDQAQMNSMVGFEPERGFLREPLLIDLDGDGKAEVIVPANKGTIAILDGSTGRERWRSTLAIKANRYHQPSVAYVLVGPDLDGDGWRDLYVVNFVHYPLSGKPALVRVQALSGNTGTPLWQAHLSGPVFGLSSVTLGKPLLAWQRGRDHWPMLVVPGGEGTFVLEGSTGHMAHVIPGRTRAIRVADLDGDGIAELLVFQSAGSFLPGWLHRFRGTSPEVWSRLGKWEPGNELEGYGLTDRNRDSLGEIILSGRDGRIQKRSTPRSHDSRQRRASGRDTALVLRFEEGRLIAREGDPPRLLWRSTISFPPNSIIEKTQEGSIDNAGAVVVRSDSAARGLLYGLDATLYGLDARTGKPLWRHLGRKRSKAVLPGSAAPRQLPLIVELVNDGDTNGPATICSLASAIDRNGKVVETEAGTPVTRQEEPVEWVPLPKVRDIVSDRYITFDRDRDEVGKVIGVGVLPALVFFVYAGFRLIRNGYRGLWFPALLLLLASGFVILGLIITFGGELETWQRYTWEGWYWLLGIVLVWAGIITLAWLGLVFALRLLRLLRRLGQGVVRLVFRRRAEPKSATVRVCVEPAAPAVNPGAKD
jgi:outer membrane protein assembly factor BamB